MLLLNVLCQDVNMLSMSRSNVTNVYVCLFQGCITCGAIDEPRKSSKAIDERVIINFRDKNVIIARFRDKHGGFIDSHSDQLIAIFFYR